MQGVSPSGNSGQKTPPEPRSTVVFMTIADTTWRMFVPSIGGVFLGIWLDSKWSTSPWMLFAGAILGLLVAAFAVWLQYRKLIDK